MLVEPRQTIRVVADPRYLLGDFRKYPIKYAYVKTACGRRRTGISPSLLDYELVKVTGQVGPMWLLYLARARVRALAWVDRHLL